jgi:hypothetical protein
VDRIKDAQVIRLVERIGEHYRANISTRFLRPVLLQLQIDKTVWDQVELLTEKTEMFNYHGFHLDELYRQIAASARFVEVARNGIPSLRGKINIVNDGPEKTIREMAASNFIANLQVFADLLNDLYAILVDLDKTDSGKNPPLYTQIPELYNIEQLLAGS